MAREIYPQRLQEEFLSSSADIAIIGGAAGCGKCIKIDTPIPTPSGWVRMGDIVDGDTLFDEQGTICTVIKAHQPITPEIAYRLTFDDGSTIDACAEHLWLTYTADDLAKMTRYDPEWKAKRRANRPSRNPNSTHYWLAERNARLAEERREECLPSPTGSIKTTAEIFATLTIRNGTRHNHAIPVCKPWQLPEADLLLDPYLLGVWLGDGSSRASTICKPEEEIRQQFIDIGFDVSNFYTDKKSFCPYGLVSILRVLGVFGDKHIPSVYLRASSSQRLSLLQGLMDTDGSPRQGGTTAEYYSSRKLLAKQVFELVISLGFKATLRTKRAKLNGKDYGDTYTVAFSTKERVFRLARKHEIHQSGTDRRTNHYRMIVSCEPIDPVPMRCLTVDSPSRLYLCGESGIPTHNTYALLLECIRNITNPQFSAIVFRRESKQIHLPGGLFDTAMEIYPGLGAKHRNQPMVEFSFRSGAKIVMTHLNQETDVAAFQGSQITLLVWDELCHFSKSQFFYLLSRNRSTCGVKPYVRASCNPDPDSWVAEFIAWWIDQNTGYPIPDRSGQLRYFIQVPTDNDTILVWGDTPDELAIQMGLAVPTVEARQQAHDAINSAMDQGRDPATLEFDDELAAAVRYLEVVKSAKSVTFIPGLIYDNPALLRRNPDYLANLKVQDRVQRARLLEGNWKVRPVAGDYFSSADARFVREVPNDVVYWVRSWDLAATEPNENNRDPDWTVGMKMGRRANGRVVIADVKRFRRNASTVRDTVYDTAQRDGQSCWIQIPRDPGQAGADQIESYEIMLAGFSLFSRPITRNKVTMAEPAAAEWQRGNIEMVIAPWNSEVLEELDKFPTPHAHDDCVDALSGGYNLLPPGGSPDYTEAGLRRRFALDNGR